MQFHLIKRKNNDKSPEIFHDENHKFKVMNIKNKSLEDERYFIQLTQLHSIIFLPKW